MKKSVLLFAMALMAFSTLPVSAETNAKTNVSGTYEGTMETKTFAKNNTKGNASSTTNWDIQLLFNGTTFIFQNGDTKCMGSYVIDGDIITFTVTSSKGNTDQINSIFNSSYKYSKSGKMLMLISNDNEDGDVFIYRLEKSNS